MPYRAFASMLPCLLLAGAAASAGTVIEDADTVAAHAADPAELTRVWELPVRSSTSMWSGR